MLLLFVSLWIDVRSPKAGEVGFYLSAVAAGLVGIQRQRQPTVLQGPAPRGVITVAALWLFASLGAFSISDSLTVMVSLLIGFCWASWGAQILRDGEDVARCGVVISVGIAVLFVLYGSAQDFKPFSLKTKLLLSGFGSPNLYGALAAVGILLILISGRKILSQWARLVALLVLIYAGADFFSRTSLLALGVSISVMILMRRAKSSRAVLIRSCGLGLVVIVVAAFLVPWLGSHDAAVELRGRTGIWNQAIVSIDSTWPAGAGYAGNKAIQLKDFEEASAPASGGYHSIYLEEIAAHGVTGVIGLVGIIAFGCWQLVVAYQRKRWLGASLLVIVFVFGAVRGVAESNGWLIDPTRDIAFAITWALLGTGLTLIRRRDLPT